MCVSCSSLLQQFFIGLAPGVMAGFDGGLDIPAVAEAVLAQEAQHGPVLPVGVGAQAAQAEAAGLTLGKADDKTGKAAGVKAVDDTDDILLISDDGTMIRMAAADVNLYSRTAQGVKVMRVAEGSKVIALARVEKVEEETMGSEDEEMDETTPDNGGTEA